MERFEAIRISNLFLSKKYGTSQQTNKSLVSLKDQGQKLNIYLLCIGDISKSEVTYLFVIEGQKSLVLSAIF